MAKPRIVKPRLVRTAADSLAVVIDAFPEWTGKHPAADTCEWYRDRPQRFIERSPNPRADPLLPLPVQPC